MADELQFLLLGGLGISRGGRPVTGFVSTKAQALLVYLAVTRRPHFREALVGLLWGEAPEADARASLRKALSNLRALAGEHLLITRATVAFNYDAPYTLDVEAFQTTLRQPPAPPDVARLEQATALYRGDFLEGFSVRDAPAFEEWVAGQREHLRELVLQALRALAAGRADRGEAAPAVETLRRLLRIDPWDERTHRELMLLLAQSGQRDAALQQYATCRRILRQELAVEPDDLTTALAEQIRAGRIEVRAG